MEKVAFIICYNNGQYMSECRKYISWLKVPDGVETEVIAISEAQSMTAGYNAAMHNSDAKYKVYLHQDVFIVNENFIQDIIDVFRQNPEYGMLGVLGSTRMISDANYLLNWNVGMIYLDDSNRQGVHEKRNPGQLQEVEAIDGMLMITQYDVEWREDIFDGFDFYDVSQSMEFKKAGYKVGVPCQEDIWCNHVCGHSKMEHYDAYREKFCVEYQQDGYCYTPDVQIAEEILKNKEIKKRIPFIEEALETEEWERMNTLLEDAMQFFMYNTQLCNLYIISKVVQAEKRENIRNGFWNKKSSAAALQEKYLWYKFLLKRLECDKEIDDMDFILKEIIESTSENLTAEKVIAEHAVANIRKVIWKLKWKIQKEYGKILHVQFDEKTSPVPDKEDCDRALNVCIDLQELIEKLYGIKEGVRVEEMLQYVKLILEAIEDIARETHLGILEESLYTAYFDCTGEVADIEIFFRCCQEWLKRTVEYIGKYSDKCM